MTQKQFLISVLFYFAWLNQQHAQTIGLSDCNPVPNTSFNYAYGSKTISPGPGGTNQIWDFSSYTIQSFYSDSFANVPSNYAGNFPTADIVRYIESSNTSFYMFSAVGVEKVGDLTLSPVPFTDPILYKPCPIVYGTSTVDACSYTGAIGPYTISTVGSTTITADGSGNLVSPGGMFANVIRLHYFSTYTTVSTNTLYTGTYVNDDYRWFAEGIVDPVFDIRNGTIVNARYYGPNLVGLKDEKGFESALQVYPNPATTKLQLNSHINHLQLSLKNSLGQVVLEADCPPEKMELDLSEILPGIYFCTVFDPVTKKQSLTKLVVNK